jgi:APA family basic amino acid/polyamine antiporter
MQIKKELGLFSSVNIVMGSVIGSGIFFVVSDITRSLPSPLWALSIWLTAGGIAFLGALCYAELGSMYPGDGGSYLYFKEAYHPVIGFLFGWTLSTVIQTGSIAAVSVSFGQVLSQIYDLSDLQIKIVSTIAIIVLTAINLLGVRKGAEVIDSFTSIKAFILLVIGLGGLSYFFVTPSESQNLIQTDYQLKPASYGVALIAAFWAYDGWVNVTYAAGEMRNAKKTLPRSMFLGLGICATLYVLVNFTYYQTLTIPEIINSPFPAGDAVNKLFGPKAKSFLQWAMIISTLGCVSAMILTGARISFAMGLDGVFPRVFSRLSQKFNSPYFALFTQMLISILLVLWGTYEQLFTFLIATSLLFYALAPIALIILRIKHPLKERPYRVPLYPFIPLLYLACTSALVVNTLLERPLEAGVGFAVMATGIPVFYALTALRKS